MADWKKLATRTFIDQIDGFPAMSLGSPPSARDWSGAPSAFPGLRLHPDRGVEQGLTPFYKQLRASNNVSLTGPPALNALGNVWSGEGREDVRFDSSPLVIIIGAFQGGRAAELPTNIPMALEGEGHPIPVRVVAGRNALELDFVKPLPESVDRNFWRTIAHELGHAFGLGDEYVELPGRYSQIEDSLNHWGNLTSEEAVRPGGVFNAAAIKWDWHRARKAAFVGGALTTSGVNFIVPVLRSGGFQFKVGDPVFLRVGDWSRVIGRAPITSGPMQVVGVDASGNSVTISGALNVPPAAFGEGSVLYVPVRDPDVAGLFLNLISPKIAKFINERDGHSARGHAKIRMRSLRAGIPSCRNMTVTTASGRIATMSARLGSITVACGMDAGSSDLPGSV